MSRRDSEMSRTKTALDLPRLYRGGRGKWVALLVVIVLVLLVIQDPIGAANFAKTVVGGLVTFVRSLFHRPV
jgi:hypothetical protein